MPSAVWHSRMASAAVVAADVMRPSSLSIASERDATRDETVLVRLPLQLLLEVRMRDPDEGLDALRDRLPFQVDHPVLGDHVHDVGARRRYDVPRRQVEDDPAATIAPLVVGR